MGPDRKESDENELLRFLLSEPMLLREFVEIHNRAMRNPWLRMQYFVAFRWRKIQRWLGWG
jgi:hypothetical protein